jgi:hypothetical protein
MKTKIFLHLNIIIIIVLNIQNQGFTQDFKKNAYTKALNVMTVLKDKKIMSALDSFKVNRGYWKDSLGVESSDYTNIRHFSKFIEDPFFEALDLSKVEPVTFLALAKKYNYFALYKNASIKPSRVGTSTVHDDDIKNERFTPISPFSISVPQSYSTGFTPAAIIDGASRFLVKRTKEELETAFFEKFRAEIEKDKILQTLIPQTYLLLRYQDYAYIPSMGETWTTAITTDLNNIPFGLSDAIVKNRPEMLEKDEVLVFLTAMIAAKQLKEGAKPYEIIYSIDKRFGQKTDKNISRLLHLSNLLSINLLREDYKGLDNAWVTIDDYKTLKPTGQKYFWAFLFGENKPFFKALNWKSEQLENIFSSLQTVEDFLNYAQKSGELLSSNDFQGNNLKKTIEVSENLIATIGSVVKMDYLMRGAGDEFYDGLFVQKYLPLTKNTLSILRNADEQNYGAALLSSLRVMNELFSEKEKTENESIKKTIFYLSFLTDVITAKEAVEVQQVIERYALPAQSYRMKRTTLHSVSINAYPGVYFGTEKISSTKENGLVGGVTAPIGFSVDWGKLGKKRNASFALFFPIIDIGAAFSYRWGNNTGATGFPEKITWKQVFSPGLYAYWGLPRAPIALGAGFQWSPELRKITGLGANFGDNALRIGVNMAVDIPVFSLWKRVNN